jgi:hypothetical protein
MHDQVPIGATCHSCRWYSDKTCHRHSPSKSGWPSTKPEEFCGEWIQNYKINPDGKLYPII